MYCSSCGAPVTQGLSYCQRCGANLKPSEALIPAKPTGLVWLVAFGFAMMGTPIGAVALVSGLIKELLERGIPFRSILPLAIFMLAIVFGAALLLSRLISPLVKAYLQTGAPAEAKKPELSGRAPAQLEAPREPASSITENTTRTFEPLYGEQKLR
jgi:hypothetical protein